MMKEDIRHGSEQVQRVIKDEIEKTVGPLRVELATEKANRQALEERVVALEERMQTISATTAAADEEVDKSLVVVGGFGDKGSDDAEEFVKEAVDDVPGVVKVFATSSAPKVALVRFDSPSSALKCIRSQKKFTKFKATSLRASENRPLEDRRRAKIVSKMKKCLIEFDENDA